MLLRSLELSIVDLNTFFYELLKKRVNNPLLPTYIAHELHHPLVVILYFEVVVSYTNAQDCRVV